MKNKKKLDILILVLVGTIIMLPFLLGGYQSADDAPFHVANIDLLTDNLRENFLFPSNIYDKLANGFGYGTKLFYPPLAHTVASYLNLIINDPCIALKILHLATVILSGITMYYLSLKLSDNRKIALVSGVIYMLFPYHLSDIYIRDALAECLIFIFIPMVFNALVSLSKGNRKEFYPLFIAGYVGCILSHLVLSVYLTVLIIIWLLIKFKETIKNLKPFIIASIIILLITSPFLVTILEHKLLGNYHVYVPGVMAGNIQFENGLHLYDFVKFPALFFSKETKFCFEIVSFILFVITIVKYKKIKDKKYLPIWLFLLATLILSTRYFPWDSLPAGLRIVQFPWRFVGFMGVAISLIAPLCLKDVKDKTVYILVGLMLVLSFGNTVQLGRWVFDTDNIWYDAGMGWQKEYLPEKTSNNYEYLEKRSRDIIVMDGQFEYELVSDELSKIEFEVKKAESAKVEFPRIYYLGYYLTDQEGNIKTLEESDHGFLQADISMEGKYTLEYKKTTIEKMSEIISLITISSSCVYLVWRRYREEN